LIGSYFRGKAFNWIVITKVKLARGWEGWLAPDYFHYCHFFQSYSPAHLALPSNADSMSLRLIACAF